MCKVVSRRLVHTWNPADEVYIGRTGPNGRLHAGNSEGYGNPFKVGVHGQRGECVELFRAWFHSDEPEAVACRDRVLRNITPTSVLVCWCKPRPCHGDVIADFVNDYYEKRYMDMVDETYNTDPGDRGR